MAIAGALVVPVDEESTPTVQARLEGLAGVEVQGVGPKGIAVVLEGADTKSLEKISKAVLDWHDVADFQLGYCNWENE